MVKKVVNGIGCYFYNQLKFRKLCRPVANINIKDVTLLKNYCY